MKFFAMRDAAGVLRLNLTLCNDHFDARWIDELILAEATDDWEDVTKLQPPVHCQICWASPKREVYDHYICGNIKVPKA